MARNTGSAVASGCPAGRSNGTSIICLSKGRTVLLWLLNSCRMAALRLPISSPANGAATARTRSLKV